MGKRMVGVVFILSSTLLFISRYISAAIFMSNVTSRNAVLFYAGLEYVGTPLLILSFISAIIGIGYLIWAEISCK